jgi:NAD(P) transhydrogenase
MPERPGTGGGVRRQFQSRWQDGMSIEQEFDVIVLGSGPGGEGASIRLAKEGRRVAVVEQQTEVGGSCTHAGTIPSKALIWIAQQLVENRHNRLHQAAGLCLRVGFGKMMEVVHQVVRLQIRERQGYYDRNDITILSGRGTFVDAHTVEVTGSDGIPRRYQTRHFVVATGSVPFRPPDVDFRHPRVVDSDTVLNLPDLPKSITIVGGGVVGCEYASAFRHLGVKINVVNTSDRILPFLDEEVSEALSYHLREQGAILHNNETFARLTIQDDGVICHLVSGKAIRSDVFFWSAGRDGNSRGLGLEALGVEIPERGRIKVNSDFQTAVPHIYAVGDVIGHPGLASASYDQGLMAGTHIFYGQRRYQPNKFIPTGIYTIPEIGAVGQTERALTEAKVPYEVGHAFFRNLARSQITGQTTGMLKILFHLETLEILGIHCFGHGASELVHLGQSVMSQAGGGNSLLYFVNTTLNYPTLAEAFRVAALNGLNRVAKL